jgi:predicted dehydrogenase
VASRLSVAPGWADWFNDPTLSGGAVLDLMIHDLDALNWVMGEPKSIYARGHQAKPDLWNHIVTIIDYGDSQGMIEASQFMPQDYPFTATLKVLCENGTAEFVFRAGGVSVEMGGGSSLAAYEAGKGYELEAKSADPYEEQITYFVDCLRNQTPPTIATPEQARLGVKMSNAARESLETGKVVFL